MDGFDKRSSRPKARQSIAHIPSSSKANSLDKQNATVDLSAGRNKFELQIQPSKKRTRGKSLGPGGLEPLTETDGNKAIPSFQPRSILKPTVPLTPPKTIPTFEELQKKSTSKKSPGRNGAEALLIDFSTPGPSRGAPLLNSSITQAVHDPFSPVKVVPKSGNDQNSIVQDANEEDQERQARKKAILEQRAARRRSMANRRVSFAPEATLHTWSVMEMAEDSTTSSASNSTRRQSTMTTEETPQQDVQYPKMNADAEEPPSTPPEQMDEPVIKASPAHQRDLHQKKRRRRSSALTTDSDVSGDEVYSSSPSGDVVTESSPVRIEDSIASDSDTDGDTAMSLDEATQVTVRSQDSDSSARSSLEERLRQAASQAGTRGIDHDENGDDLSMELANDTVTRAFQPWAQSRKPRDNLNEDDQDATESSPSKALNNTSATIEQDETETSGLTMEMTKAVGGILESSASPSRSRRKSTLARRRSSMGRRRSMAAESGNDDSSMDFTTMAGGILSTDSEKQEPLDESDEDMTMEFTTAVGGVKYIGDEQGAMQLENSEENETMDMTAAVGGILDPIEEQTEPQTDAEDDKTMAMDMTRAVGQIMTSQPQHLTSSPRNKSESTKPMGRDVITEIPVTTQRTPKQRTSVASETGSPSIALKTRSAGRAQSGGISLSAISNPPATKSPGRMSPKREHSTPIKQLTPTPTRVQTPERTPLSRSIGRGSASARKLFEAELQAKVSPAKMQERSIGERRDLLFAEDEFTGRQTPRVVLHAPKPHQHLRRRSSGIGIDREGFGSPSVTQLLAHRSSIGDVAPEFQLHHTPIKRTHFEDPKQLGKEVDAERAEEERRESGRFTMTQEANGQNEENTTLQLKEMIESMSPRKGLDGGRKLKGRKSLAVGSARGVLGKRPTELDDEDNDSESTPKRLRAISRDGSPVKKIHLPKPPSKEETTGRLTKPEQKALELATAREHTPVLPESSFDAKRVESPRQINRYRDLTKDSAKERPQSFEDKLDNVIGAVDVLIEHPQASNAVTEEDKISLQRFLNMTNIHFIELNATKRRHTMVQPVANGTVDPSDRLSDSLESHFITATTTMPLLELYQHATRELKSYISAGRKIIRSIETETLTEQPPLFREYIEARPDVKLVMDNQFRNGKTNARLQSKAGWYTWRSQLIDGLRSGLESIRNDVEMDLAVVDGQASDMANLLPSLQASNDALSQELSSLRQRLIDIENVNHDAVKAKREHLQSLDQEFERKKNILATLQSQMRDKTDILSQAAELKDEMQEQITEASRVMEEHRGWASKDILALKHKTNGISNTSGWSLLVAEEDPDESDGFGVALTMCYKDALKLYFFPSMFHPKSNDNNIRRRSGHNLRSASGPSAPISLTFSPKYTENEPEQRLSTESRFFLQLMQGQLQAFSMLPKGSIDARTVLNTVSSGWNLACKISEEVRLLDLIGVTRVFIQSDDKLAAKLMLMLEDGSRVDIEFCITAGVFEDGEISTATSVAVAGIYGLACKIMDGTKTRKIQAALSKETVNRAIGDGSWIRAVQAFEEWYRLQCQSKVQSVKPQKEEVVANTYSTAAVRSTTPTSPIPAVSKTLTVKRSPLTTKKVSAIQKKTIPVSTLRQDKLRTSQRDQPPQPNFVAEKTQSQTITEQEMMNGKENLDPFVTYTAPAMPPEMQESMMQRTPIKRVGALRRSPI